MSPPSIDVDGLGSNLSYDSYQTQIAQEYRNGHSESLSASDNSKFSAICPSSLLSALPQVPAAPPAQMGHRPLRGAILTLAKGAGLRLDWLVFVQEPLVGRGTCLVRATATRNWNTTEGSDTTDGDHIVKDSDAVEDTDATENTGTTGHRDTTKDYEKLNHTWLIKRLSEILRCKALKFTLDNAQFRLAEHLKCDGNHYEDRVLQAMLMTELFPITELKTSNEVVPAIRDIFKSYRLLYESTKIIHGDISLDSLKCRKIDGKIYGVLIDYDLSEQGPNLKQRMGTMPYMAVDLLEPTPTKHLYRYDLESLFYVFAVLVTRYDRGEVIENPPLQNWFELPPSSLRPKKVTFLCKLPAQPTSTFENLEDFLLCMGLMFRAGYDAQDNHLLSVRRAKNPKSTLVDRKAILNSKFNHETLEGNVDFDKFQTLLNDLNTTTQA